MIADAANNLSALYVYLEQYLSHRIETSLEMEDITPKPELVITEGTQHPLNALILENELTEDEVVMILVALTPHLYPGFFERILLDYMNSIIDFYDFGGVMGKNQKGMLPTGTTALFIMAGNNDTDKLVKRDYFEFDSKLFELGVLSKTGFYFSTKPMPFLENERVSAMHTINTRIRRFRISFSESRHTRAWLF